MDPRVIYGEPAEARAQAMIAKFVVVYGLIVCLVFAIISILGAPSWLVWPLAAGCVVGSIPVIMRLWRGDRQVSDWAARPVLDHSFIVPLESPPPPRNFEGRTAELRRIRDVVHSWSADGPAIVNIAGPPGMGKTALATQFAYLNQDLFPDGQLFASLDHAADCDSLIRYTLGRFLAALQIAGEQVVESAAGQSKQYAKLTANSKLLVILDNASDPGCARKLLPSGGKCTVIVTSREPMVELHPALIVRLTPLSGSEAIRLLESAVGQHRVQAQSQAARQLVGAGHPLGIQLAANALSSRPYWSLDQVMTPKPDRQELPASPDALTEELDLAIELLTKEERKALRCIALLDKPVFESWELAALLGISEADALRLGEHLSRTGIIKLTSVGRAGIVEFVVDDYVWQYLRLRMGPQISSATRTARRRALDDERNAGGRRPDTVRRLNETIQEWRDAGWLAEALEASRDAVATTQRSGDRPAEALALATLADLQAGIGNIEEAYALAEAACQVRGVAAPARALRCLARVARRRGQIDMAEKKLEEALATARQSGDAAEEVKILIERALTLALTVDRARSVVVADEAVALCHDHQVSASPLSASLFAGASFARSYALLDCGRAQEASDCLAKAVVRASDKQALWLAWMAWLRGRTALALGEHRPAIEACMEAIERFGAMSHRFGDGCSRMLLGRVYARAGSDRLDEAIMLASDAMDTFGNCGDRSAEDEAKRLLSSLLHRRGHELLDVHDLEEAARISEVLGDDESLTEIRDELAATRPDPPARHWKALRRQG
jgi:tetratricopeptide (TPR) repeat protein